MRIHHFYPRTPNIGDHFVQRGIARMFQNLIPDCIFELFDVNSRGEDKKEFGLTRKAIRRANSEAELIVIGGSNLYEGSLRWPWGVHLEVDALNELRVPVFLVGIGSGSNFTGRLHQPSARAASEIKLLNSYATFSGARDVNTFEWLQEFGVSKARLMGDPATFIFNLPERRNQDGHILITVPPRRFWSSKRQLWNIHTRGRAMFRALAALGRRLVEEGRDVAVVCNDPADIPTARMLFGAWLPTPIACPKSPEEYFELLGKSSAVVSGRLHTAVVAFSLGIPFLLLNVDQRTEGFIKTYQLGDWAIDASLASLDERLAELTGKLLKPDPEAWGVLVEERDRMHARAMHLLGEALRPGIT